MEDMLTRCGEEIDVLYSHNDAMTLGAIEVMEENGIRPGEDIVIITVDGEQAAIDLLKEGKINCVVECSPMLGDAVMDLAEKMIRGEEYPRNTHPEERCFTEYDDLTDLAPRGY
jgi:simple sugar transport system substrate-binding protein